MDINDYKYYLIIPENENDVLDVFIILQKFEIGIWSGNHPPNYPTAEWKRTYRKYQPGIYLGYSTGLRPCFRGSNELPSYKEQCIRKISAKQFISDYYES